MGIKLNIEVTSPLSQDDHELLTGIAVMTLAIANREIAKESFPGVFLPDDDPLDAERPGTAKAGR